MTWKRGIYEIFDKVLECEPSMVGLLYIIYEICLMDTAGRGVPEAETIPYSRFLVLKFKNAGSVTSVWMGCFCLKRALL